MTCALAVLAAAVSLLAPTATVGAEAQTTDEIELRDRLIYEQEALLNVYRCRFNIDTQIVSGGCPRGEPGALDGQYTAVAAGQTHSCAIRTDQTITCWGTNWSGETDAPAGQYTAVAAGETHSCAIRTDQTITCWGSNSSGQADAPYGRYTAVAAGGAHSCALRADQTVTCWGINQFEDYPPEGP